MISCGHRFTGGATESPCAEVTGAPQLAGLALFSQTPTSVDSSHYARAIVSKNKNCDAISQIRFFVFVVLHESPAALEAFRS